MTIAILGSGAMGSLFGGRLAAAGEQVVLLDVNREHVAAINQNGLTLDLDEGIQSIRVPASAPAGFDATAALVILFTKTMHSEAALALARHMIDDDTVVMTIQNGLGNVERIEAVVPREQIIVGMTTYPADLAGPGHVVSHGAGIVRINSADGTVRPRDTEIARRLSSAGLIAQVDEHVEAAIWNKDAFNAVMNALAAVTGATPGVIGDSADGLELALAVASEACVVAMAGGHRRRRTTGSRDH